ncbi:MAG: transporter substrate-binding domain-containing protein [Clostridia bacterium]|jgi:polar amino acid transport system substrate-binding protein|nr:transporter substrate-binding domain-containing protein [Clostridia bacterium]MBQ6000981.1 transporter substrate-binding domain-containing protein [Clostridia bacterium]MBQ6058899.1 transporter substrate-binding domain-containing protein [Clostridia bacterium]
MKRFTALLLTLLILATLCLSGCSEKEPEYANALERIKAEGKIVMATNPEWAPYEFENLNAENEEDKYVGADIELGRYIAEQLGVELQIDAMSFETVIESIAQGRADMGISGLAYREERAQAVLLAGPYGVGESYQGALVRKEDAAELNTIESLFGRKIGVQISSLQYELAEKYLQDCEYNLFSNPVDGVLALRNGKVDAVLIASATGQGYCNNYDDIQMSDLRFPADTGEYVAINKENTELYDAILEIVLEAESSGKFAAWLEEATALAESLGVN